MLCGRGNGEKSLDVMASDFYDYIKFLACLASAHELLAWQISMSRPAKKTGITGVCEPSTFTSSVVLFNTIKEPRIPLGFKESQPTFCCRYLTCHPALFGCLFGGP